MTRICKLLRFVNAPVQLALGLPLVSTLVLATTIPRNVTIDDTYGDPVTGTQVAYSPSPAWNVGQNCSACTAHPDASDAYNHTWHDATFNPVSGSNSVPGSIVSATVSFNGTAVYVYCILAHTVTSPDGASDMTFYIDNQPVGNFTQAPDGDPAYTYNALVYANQNLTLAPHTISIEAGYGGYKSLILLDYITYTSQVDLAVTPNTSTVDPGITGVNTSGVSSSTLTSSLGQSTQSTSHSHVAVIAGGVAGGAGVVILVIALVFTFIFCRRRNRPARIHSTYLGAEPFDPDPMTFASFNRASNMSTPNGGNLLPQPSNRSLPAGADGATPIGGSSSASTPDGQPMRQISHQNVFSVVNATSSETSDFQLSHVSSPSEGQPVRKSSQPSETSHLASDPFSSVSSPPESNTQGGQSLTPPSRVETENPRENELRRYVQQLTDIVATLQRRSSVLSDDAPPPEYPGDASQNGDAIVPEVT